MIGGVLLDNSLLGQGFFGFPRTLPYRRLYLQIKHDRLNKQSRAS